MLKPVAVFYATREGQTRHIAEHLASALRDRDLRVDLHDVRELEPGLDLDHYSAVVLAASVHAGRHEREMERFARTNREALDALPSAFLSVSLSEAGVEMRSSTPEARKRAAADVQKLLDDFYARTGWHPARVQPVAGALMYTQYNLLIRFVMKRIARAAGGSTDTSRDHVYTDWLSLDAFAGRLADELKTHAGTGTALVNTPG